MILHNTNQAAASHSQHPLMRCWLVTGSFLSVDDKDPYRVAKMLMDMHGDQAKARATERLVDMRMVGDEVGAQVWRRVINALTELQATGPASGTKLH